MNTYYGISVCGLKPTLSSFIRILHVHFKAATIFLVCWNILQLLHPWNSNYDLHLRSYFELNCYIKSEVVHVKTFEQCDLSLWSHNMQMPLCTESLQIYIELFRKLNAGFSCWINANCFVCRVYCHPKTRPILQVEL